MSLAVKDIPASLAFYSSLGFQQFGGDPDHGYAMIRNGDHVLGLFQGMFDANILTFNPGWDQAGGETESFTDVRAIKQALIAQGVEVPGEIETANGPGSIMLMDPDGNQILIDQHR